MMHGYDEVFAAVKGLGRALTASNWSVSIVFKWVNIRVFVINTLPFSEHAVELATLPLFLPGRSGFLLVGLLMSVENIGLFLICSHATNRTLEAQCR
jgi:hypothetical protein